MKFLGFGKKKDKKKDAKKEENKPKTVEQKKDNLSGVSGGEVNIKVFMTFGGSVNTLKDQFTAVETRDGAGGLLFYNQDKMFVEDVDFEKDDVFRELKIILEIKEKTPKEQLKILDKKIDRQKKIIAYLMKHDKLNAVYNFADEDLKLRDLQVLRSHIDNIDEKQGSFYTLEGGKRTFSFLKKDGFFYPIWHGVSHYSTYPDYIRKRKIHTAETEIFKTEWGNKLKRILPIATIITLAILLVILILGNLYVGTVLLGKNADMDKQLHGQAFKCAEYTSAMNMQIGALFSNKCIDMLMDEENMTRIEIADKYVPAIKDLSPEKQ